MQRKAKIFMNNRSQAVRLPKEFQFDVQEVFIRKEGADVVLSPRPLDWSSYLANAPVPLSVSWKMSKNKREFGRVRNIALENWTI